MEAEQMDDCFGGCLQRAPNQKERNADQITLFAVKDDGWVPRKNAMKSSYLLHKIKQTVYLPMITTCYSILLYPGIGLN